jgi:hypothetical protein
MTFSSRRVKEEDSNDKTWGKGSGSSRRYIRHEESTNGSSTRWLASGERSVRLTSVVGKSDAKGGRKLRPPGLLLPEEREGVASRTTCRQR